MKKVSALPQIAFLLLVLAAQQARPPMAPSPAKAPPVNAPLVNAKDALRRNNLGAAYMNQQQFERALKLFSEARALDQNLEAARLNEGIALVNLQQFEAADAALEAVVQADPGNSRAWYNLGLLRKNQGGGQPALDAFQHAARLAPADPDVFYFIGVLQSQIGNQKEAIAAFRQALERNPFHASAEFGLSRALQRAGEGAPSKEHLARFQQLTQTKLGVPMSLAYGDQGALSLAEQPAHASTPGPAIRVRFVDITRESGLAWAGLQSANGPSVGGKAAGTGSGACFFDLDNDGRPDLVLADGGPQGGMALLHNSGHGRFEDITQKAGLNPRLHGIACAAGDYDNDGHTDLALTTEQRVYLFHNQGDNTFKETSQVLGVEGSGAARSGSFLGAAFVDYDHDGDLDLYVSSSEPGKNTLWRNNGNHTFTDITAETGLAGNSAASAATFGAVSTDFNNDRAIDLFLASGKPQLWINPREGQWTAAQLHAQAMALPAVGAAVLDFDKDGWMDLALSHDGAPGITLWRNLQGRTLEQVRLPIQNWRRAWGVAALDYDNDGWIDLAAVGETNDGRGEVRLFRNVGMNGFQDVTAETGLDSVKLTDPRALQAVDFEGNGATGLLITQAHGPVVLLRNEGGRQNNFLRIALVGLNDNKSAVGAKVEVFAGALWQKWETGAAGYLSQSSTGLVAGLGQEPRVDVVRVLWPTGVVQDEAELASNSLQKILEIDRRGSSCPLLFAWDGSRYRFVADMLGAGVLGHWIAPGERNLPDPTEYMKVEGERARLRNGLLSFRFMEPMEEAVYLDQVRLLAIDHPADMEVYPNEYFAGNPPFPEFKVIASRRAQPPAGVWDERGRDVLPLLQARDHRYVGGFRLLPYKGFTQPHALEIELPQSYQGGPLRLLMYGYIEYFTANSMYAASQAGIHPVAPRVEALDRHHHWVTILEDMGFPAGLPRTTVANLSGRLPVGATRLRITTNLQIYWDQVLVDRTPEPRSAGSGFKITELPLAGSQLAFHGYPRAVEGPFPGDLRYIYEDASPTGPYARQAGAYTRMGDVRELLLRSDDRFVVFGGGEEVRLDFDPKGLPALLGHWKRDYFFFADGYEKDRDFYAAQGESVYPTPFHAMEEYPPKHDSPEENERLSYQLDYNDRFVSETPPTSFRFRYPKPANGAVHLQSIHP